MYFDHLKEKRQNLYTIIFESDTREGKIFNYALIAAIIISVLTVIVESVFHDTGKYHLLFTLIEWFFTILFTVEYILRLWVVQKRLVYTTSFYGIIDLLSILPTYLSIVFPGLQYLMDIRILRLMRIFRLLKLTRFITEGTNLKRALVSSYHKIIVFFSTIALLMVVIGSIMYVVEGPANGFHDIPTSIYWAVVTITTVGYGDISPQTGLGQFIASIAMIIGYSIIAVPAGIFSAEFVSRKKNKSLTTQVCPVCLKEDHEVDAVYCKHCGSLLNP